MLHAIKRVWIFILAVSIILSMNSIIAIGEEENNIVIKDRIQAKVSICTPDFTKTANNTNYLPYRPNSYWVFRIRLKEIDNAPMPNNAVDGYIDILCHVNFKESTESDVCSFGEIEYAKPGTYIYEIEAITSSSLTYFEYDSTPVRRVSVTVTKEEETGLLRSKVDYGSEQEYLTFTHRYKCGNVKAKMIISGRESEDQEYTVDFALSGTNDATNRIIDYFTVCVIEYNADGTQKGFQRFNKDSSSLASPIKLKNGEWFEIIGLPEGTQYTISQSDPTIYEIEYSNQQETIIDNNCFNAIIYNRLDDTPYTVTARVEAKLFFIATKPAVDGEKLYIYPGIKTPLTVSLIGMEEDTPMPEGTRDNVFEITGTFAVSTSRTTSARAGRCTFDIPFTMNDLEGEDRRVFKYRLVHGKSNQEIPVNYIEYNIDKKNEDAKTIDVTITVVKVSASVIDYEIAYEKDEYLFPDQERNIDQTEMARFMDQFLSASIEIEKTTSEEDPFIQKPLPVILALSTEEDTSFEEWQFQVDFQKAGEEIEKQAQTTNSNGELVFALGTGDRIVVYGIPTNVRYSIEEDTSNGEYFYSTYETKKLTDQKNLIYEMADREGIINADGFGSGKVLCRIKDIPTNEPLFVIPRNIYLEVGDDYRVPIKNNSSSYQLIWEIQNKEVASINQNGVIKAVAEGKTSILLTDLNQGITRRTMLYVIPVITEISFNLDDEKENFSLIPYETYELKAFAFTGDKTIDESGFIVLRSSNEEVATIDQDGIIHAKAPGKTIITATSPKGFTASRELTVREATTIRIPDGIRIIEEGAFLETSAEIYIIPDSVERIEEYAFGYLPNAKLIVMSWNAVKASNPDAFISTNARFVLPGGELYKKEELWQTGI